MDDKVLEGRVIHILKLVIGHTQSSHRYNHLEIMNDIVVGSMDAKSENPFVLG